MTLALFLIILSGLIFIHELGHFSTAKKFGVRVEEFGIGLPPKAKTLFRKGETEYTLNWLPIGGFVRLLGENREVIKDKKDKKRAFYNKPIWQRAIILLAGIIANLLVGVVLFSVIYTFTGVPRYEGERVMVISVEEGSPAQIAGISQGDVFVGIDGQDVVDVDWFIDRVSESKEESVVFRMGKLTPDGTLEDQIRQVNMIPRENPPEGQGALGISLSGIARVEYDKKPWYSAPFYGAVDGMKEAYYWSREIIVGIVQVLYTIVTTGAMPQGVSGPVGIYKMTGEVSQHGVMAILRFIAILSINLGMFNLLPIPALDGGRLMFLVFEKIFGSKRISKIEGYVNMVGYLALMGLLVFITWNDIINLF